VYATVRGLEDRLNTSEIKKYRDEKYWCNGWFSVDMPKYWSWFDTEASLNRSGHSMDKWFERFLKTAYWEGHTLFDESKGFTDNLETYILGQFERDILINMDELPVLCMQFIKDFQKNLFDLKTIWQKLDDLDRSEFLITREGKVTGNPLFRYDVFYNLFPENEGEPEEEQISMDSTAYKTAKYQYIIKGNFREASPATPVSAYTPGHRTLYSLIAYGLATDKPFLEVLADEGQTAINDRHLDKLQNLNTQYQSYLDAISELEKTIPTLEIDYSQRDFQIKADTELLEKCQDHLLPQIENLNTKEIKIPVNVAMKYTDLISHNQDLCSTLIHNRYLSLDEDIEECFNPFDFLRFSQNTHEDTQYLRESFEDLDLFRRRLFSGDFSWFPFLRQVISENADCLKAMDSEVTNKFFLEWKSDQRMLLYLIQPPLFYGPYYDPVLYKSINNLENNQSSVARIVNTYEHTLTHLDKTLDRTSESYVTDITDDVFRIIQMKFCEKIIRDSQQAFLKSTEKTYKNFIETISEELHIIDGTLQIPISDMFEFRKLSNIGKFTYYKKHRQTLAEMQNSYDILLTQIAKEDLFIKSLKDSNYESGFLDIHKLATDPDGKIYESIGATNLFIGLLAMLFPEEQYDETRQLILKEERAQQLKDAKELREQQDILEIEDIGSESDRKFLDPENLEDELVSNIFAIEYIEELEPETIEDEDEVIGLESSVHEIITESMDEFRDLLKETDTGLEIETLEFEFSGGEDLNTQEFVSEFISKYKPEEITIDATFTIEETPDHTFFDISDDDFVIEDTEEPKKPKTEYETTETLALGGDFQTIFASF